MRQSRNRNSHFIERKLISDLPMGIVAGELGGKAYGQESSQLSHVCCSVLLLQSGFAFIIYFIEFVRYLLWFQMDLTGEPYCTVLHDKL